MGSHSGFGHVLTYSAPTVSVLLASGFLYARAQVRIHSLRRALPRTLETFTRVIEDPNTPDDVKSEYKKKIADVHSIQADAELSHLDFIGKFWL